jgi:hypothetical protein
MLLQVIAFALLIPSYATITDCNPSSIFRPTKIAVSPDPPIPGKPVDLTLIFTNTGPEITSGTVTTTISLNGLPLPSSKESLCDNTACPISSGYNDRSTEYTWPSSVTGTIKSQINWTGPNGESLLCINSVFKIPGSWNPLKLLW